MTIDLAISLMASIRNTVTRTMDRFHLMIGLTISWAVVTCGFMLAAGWEQDNPKIIFWIGILPIFASYIALVHFDRRYHGYDAINREITQIIQSLICPDPNIPGMLGVVSRSCSFFYRQP